MAELLTSPEVAEMLGTTLRRVQRMAKDGRLPVAQKLAGRGDYLFDPNDIVESLGERSVDSDSRLHAEATG